MPVWYQTQTIQNKAERAKSGHGVAERSGDEPRLRLLFVPPIGTSSTQDTHNFKTTFRLNVGCHSVNTPSIHDQTGPLDLMHRCLNVDEIVRLIACELVASGGKATAVHLACCCKSLEDPVLDTLWATQFDLSNLLGCFPGDVWNEGRYTVSAPMIYVLFFLNSSVRKSFERLPTAAEWARFREYARRVREFRGHGAAKTLSSEVYSVIQLYTFDEPLLPNLKTLDLWGIEESFIPFIPSFLSPRIASISFTFNTERRLPESVVASLIVNLPTPCPNLRDISLPFLPRDPMITAAVSNMFFSTNRNALREFCVDSPLTEETTEMIYKLQNLRKLVAVIKKGTSIPSVSLPNLTRLEIQCEDGSDGLQLLHRAIFGKLQHVDLDMESKPIDDLLEVFKGAALSSSIQDTLLAICLTTDWPWNPDYSSLLPFTQLVDLKIEFPCDGGCSGVDDSIVIDLSWAMPGLQSLWLGNEPCNRPTGGVTAKGLAALAHNCPNLSSLCVHFQADSLSDPPMGLETARDAGYSASWTGCALTELEVGAIPVPEGSASIVALTLLRIFPWIETIRFTNYIDEAAAWSEVAGMIRRSKQIVDCSSQYHHLNTPRKFSLTVLRSQIHDR